MLLLFSMSITISIHTPTQGVTSRSSTKSLDIFNFNPHSHAGSDLHTGQALFPHTHFNPHSHAGSDQADSMVLANGEISIHTPTQGVTFLRHLFKVFCSISIHTPTQGVTTVRQDTAAFRTISIHTPTQGVTCGLCDFFKHLLFQSTLPRRE